MVLAKSMGLNVCMKYIPVAMIVIRIIVELLAKILFLSRIFARSYPGCMSEQ